MNTASRTELRSQVENRRSALMKTLAAEERAGRNIERIDALRIELRRVEDALIGGWARLADATLRELASWLKSTTHLVDEKKRRPSRATTEKLTVHPPPPFPKP